jgi:phage/plasmid-associated DNA primase
MATEDFLKWVQDFETDNEKECTHSIDKKLYTIPNKEISNFYTKAQSAIAKRTIRERIPELTPAFFSITASTEDGMATDETISTLAQVGLSAVLSVNPQGEDKTCIVLRSPIYQGSDGEVESILFLFPRLLIWREKRGNLDAFSLIRERIITEFKIMVREAPELASWDIKEAMNNKTLKVLPIYGSSPANSLARRFYKAYNEKGDELKLDEVFDERERSLPACYMYSLNRLSKRTEQVNELSPGMKKLQSILSLLGSHRTEDPSDRIVIAQAIHTETNGSPEGLELLEEFMSDNKTRELWCLAETSEKKYNGMDLRYMASKDNPVQFQKMVDLEIKPLLWSSIGPHGSDLQLSRILKVMYGHIFLTDSEGEWYKYEETHWVEDGDVEMRRLMRDELLPIYEKLYNTVDNHRPIDQAEQKAYKERANKCSSIIKKLGTSAPKNQILKEAADLFLHKGIENKLDGPLSYFTFAFADCVYDLNTKTFAKGRPNDMCKRSSPVRILDGDYSMSHSGVKMVLEYYRKVFVDEDLMWYYIDSFACCLEGGNRHKSLKVLEGQLANNSKSSSEYKIRKGFGGYAAVMPTAVAVSKNRGDANGPTPAFVHAQGARVVFLQETSGHEHLNSGVIKELSSGVDAIPIRGLHKNFTEFIPSFKIFLVCNKAPRVSPEPAIFIRLRLIQFLSQFLSADQVPEDEEEQRKQRKFVLDSKFTSKIPQLVSPFMWLLCERYKLVGEFGPKEPEIIKETLTAYQLANDVYLRFINDCIEEAEGGVNMDDVYSEFKEWFKRRYPDARTNSQDEVHSYFGKKYGDPEYGNTWTGIRLRPRIGRRTLQ